MTGDDVRRLGVELGLDAVGITRAEAYEDTERAIRDRRARGLFAEMKFTMAKPEVSCHPELLVPGARSVVSAALCYWRPESALRPGAGRLARYTWEDAYTDLRDKLGQLGERLGGTYRVLVDANQHVDRAAAARSGVGFYGKNTLLITRRHGSWVVLGALVTDVDLVATPPLDTNCGDCRLCIDACPTGALDEAGTLDATRCLSYWTQAPQAIPVPYRAELGSQVYGCDICQDVCPWNRGVEKRRDELEPTDAGHVDLRRWLEADGRALAADYERLFVPRNDPRWLRRNALVALGNTGDADDEPLLERYAAGEDELLAEHAAWALAEVRARSESR
jgi:epoxyqueuosine reductase